MTRLDGTGPNGEGPKTGLGRGNCVTNSNENNIQPTGFFGWFRRFGGFGRGKGMGRIGAGRGQGGGQGKGMGRGQGRGMGKGFGR